VQLPRIGVKRPVTIIMLILICILLGGIALSQLPIELLPELDLPVAVVITEYEGAGPEEIESLITRPLEEALQIVGNVDSLTSFSQEGESMILIEFDWGTDLNFAVQDVRQQLDLAREFLPDDAADPYTLEFDPTEFPILEYGITGDNDLYELRQVVENDIQPRLERLGGVASIDIRGGYEREIEVNLDPTLLQSYQVSLEDIVQGIYAANLDLPAGDITIEEEQQLLLRTLGEFDTLEDLRQVRVPGQSGVYRLQELARIEDGFKDLTEYTRVDGQDSVSIEIHKEADANTVEAAERVREEMVAIQEDLGDGIKFSTIADQSEFVVLAINTVTNNAVLGGLLAIGVLLAFLASLAPTVIIAVAIPVSIITTFFLLYNIDMTLNIMSLGGLALGTGMLVDNAIVVLESIFRHRTEGAAADEAAVSGTREIMAAITASTLTTLMVFLPVIFIEGIASQIFQDLSFTVAFSLLVSLLVSITVIPMLCSRLLTRTDPAQLKEKQEHNLISRQLQKLAGLYGKILEKTLRYRSLILPAGALFLLLSLLLIPIIGTEFLPPLDEGQIRISIEMPRGTPHGPTDQLTASLEEELEQLPELRIMQTRVGEGRMGDVAEIMISLVDLDDRDRSTREVIEEIRSITADKNEAEIEVSAISTLMGGEEMDDAPLQVNLMGDDLDQVQDFAEEILQVVEGIPGTREPGIGIDEERPELRFEVDRGKAGSFGLAPAQIASAVQTAVEGQVASRFREEEGSEIDILVRLEEEARNDPEVLKRLPLTTPAGTIIPLQEVATIEEGLSPIEIRRLNQTRMIPVYAQIYGIDLGSIVDELDKELEAMEFPAGISHSYGSETEWMEEAFSDLYLVLLLGLILVFMVLASQFESLWQPLVILFSVPFGFVGVAVSLLLTGWTLNMASMIGAIMLVGIVVNNSIVFLDYINQLRRQGLERREAIIKAGRIRLRPVLMTSSTTILAMLPLALGWGEGAELQAPIAISVIGGLLVAAFSTLLIMPALYTFFEDTISFVRRLLARPFSS